MTKSEDETPLQSANGPEAVSESVNRVKGVEKPTSHAAEEESSEGLNPYQPEELTIDLNKIYAAGAVKRRISTIPLRTPNKHEFVRTRREDEFWRPAALIEFERSIYLIHPEMTLHLDERDFYYAFLCLTISKSGELFFWPLKISSSGRANMWNDSALEIARKAKDVWLKIRSRHEDGRGSGFYEADVPIAQFDEPIWPNKTLKQLYDIAFKGDRIIDRVDHLVIQKLTGQIK